MKTLILASAIFFLSSCATTKYVSIPIPLPEQPSYVKVSATELSCLTDATYVRLALSITQRNEHITTLENIIKGTHQ